MFDQSFRMAITYGMHALEELKSSGSKLEAQARNELGPATLISIAIFGHSFWQSND